MLALSVTLIQRQVLSALAATVTASLGISDFNYGWLSSAFATAYLLGSLPTARLMQRIGPRVGFAGTLAVSSAVIGLHALVPSYAVLLGLRAASGLSVAPSFACATQTVHRVLPFKDRARGIGLLYMGNSLGSAVCPPLAVALASAFGWRQAFFWASVIGLAWVPLWIVVAFTGGARSTLDAPAVILPSQRLPSFDTTGGHQKMNWRRASSSFAQVARNPGVMRGSLVVASAAPVTAIMLLWGTKYLVRDHGLTQTQTGRYLWLPALLFGAGSLIFGELRSRSARSRSKTRPPYALMATAMLMSALIAVVPSARAPQTCILIASLAMAGAGGLYTLATNDMLSQAPTGKVAPTSSFTTLTQSLIYIIVSPIIGRVVEVFGGYRWVMIGAGLWAFPGCMYWFFQAWWSSRATVPPTPAIR
ncbi:MAG TPA: MFS transporter [Polyangiaceae bacterium]|jgi:predicted MFS family arabinose efflux permease|nr:MFS transporter [Polyangiaceae bacterium]